MNELPDIKPHTPIVNLDRDISVFEGMSVPIDEVAPAVGMLPTFIRKVTGKRSDLSAEDVLLLLDQDAFAETYLPRSRVLGHLFQPKGGRCSTSQSLVDLDGFSIHCKSALEVADLMPAEGVDCIVTSTPYWAMRLYNEALFVEWADGEICPYGHEQTPEGFIRHTTEILLKLKRILAPNGSIWWNVMDSFNTRTQIRGNAAEALNAMQGNDRRKWTEHNVRRYSAGHSYLKDGEQCMIPARIAERAARIGLYVKSIITWAKTAALPEPQETRVSRNLEYIIHFSKVRAPKFFKAPYRELPRELGGRDVGREPDKLCDVWTLSTSSGRDGHGAQFPVSLPGRCIAISSEPGDLVFDPFMGAGNTGVAALELGRRFIGTDVVEEYVQKAKARLSEVVPNGETIKVAS